MNTGNCYGMGRLTYGIWCRRGYYPHIFYGYKCVSIRISLMPLPRLFWFNRQLTDENFRTGFFNFMNGSFLGYTKLMDKNRNVSLNLD